MADPTFDAERNVLLLGGQRIVFHCHHYNVVLQRSIDEMLGDRAATVQVDAAAESAHRMLADVLAKAGSQWSDKLRAAEHVFSSNGFGRADVSGLDAKQGGVVLLPTSHYAVGWRSKFGEAAAPVCHFATGYWRGAFAAMLGVGPKQVHAKERRCHAVHGGSCEIEVEVR